ncbi:MAG: UDP-N-acetylmuramoyl-L-alanyl-D-glutamate--2,6-diaminopimelate ligase [Pirellulales bacterium]
MQMALPAGGGISLRQLLPDARFVGAEDIRVTSCAADSRACQRGDLFAALPGSECDGIDFVHHALARGAKGLLVDQPVDDVPLPQCLVSDVREAFGNICQALAGNPSQQLRVIGITGTNGKTTTSYLVAGVLEAAGLHAGVAGTLGIYDGAELRPSRLTTPGAAELAHSLATMYANGCSHAVLEVSSHALAQRRVAGIEFDVAAFTNVRHDHLDYHKSPEEYLAAKSRLLELVRPEGLAVFNTDDAQCGELAADFYGPALTVGMEHPAEITATPAERFISEQTFLLSTGDTCVPVRTPLVGQHNVSNCLIAAAVGLAYQLDLATIVRGLESVASIPGRLERIECGQGFGVFVDYAHTADALAQVLDSLRPLTRGRLICVFGAGGDRDRFKRPHMGRAVQERADVAVVTSDNPRYESPRKIANEILAGMRHRSQVRVELDRGTAICWALREARPGDCVLIAGKGHEECQIVEEERYYFDDREIARQWLYDHEPLSPAARRAA